MEARKERPRMKRFCLALDLKDDPELIAEYKKQHENVWPEIRASIVAAGIRDMEIYQVADRLLMVLETEDEFSFTDKDAADRGNEKVQEWERLMWRYQKALPHARDGEKWMLMERIFSLDNN